MKRLGRLWGYILFLAIAAFVLIYKWPSDIEKLSRDISQSEYISVSATVHGENSRDMTEYKYELRQGDAGYDEIKSAFPALDAEGPLDRKKLGEIVFNDSGELKKLNEITHKYVCRRIMEIIEKNSRVPFAAIDAVELVESGAGEMCDTIVAIIAPVSMRIDRIMSREGISMGYATMRIAAQKSDKYYEENCDIVIRNDYNDRESFEKKCFEIFEKILEE